MNDAQKKTPLPVAAGQEGNTSSLADTIVPQPSQSVKERKDRKPWDEEAENRLRLLVNSGWNAKQIARKLGYSESTIQKHIPAAKAKLKEQYGEPPLGNLKQALDRERDEKKPSTAPLEKIVVPVAADSGLLAPGKPLMKTFDTLKEMVTYSLCCDIQDCCADQQGVLMTIAFSGEIYTLELKKEEP